MSNVFKLKNLAMAQETTFGTTPGAGFAGVYLATDINFSPSVDTFVYNPVRTGFGDSYEAVKQTHKSLNTLSFRIPLHGFLQDTAAYADSNAPLASQLQELFYHCLGGTDLVNRAPQTPDIAAWTTSSTPRFTGNADAVSDVSSMVATNPAASGTKFQARNMFGSYQHSANVYMGQLNGRWMDDAGSVVACNSLNDMYYSNTAYMTNGATFPHTYSFELAGDDTNDAWILEGCAGTCAISGTVNDLCWADFTFNVAKWTKTTRASLTYLGSDAFKDPVVPPYGEPLPWTGSQCSYHKKTSTNWYSWGENKLINALSFSLDMGMSIERATSLGSDEGTGFWYKSAFSPKFTIESYWADELDDLLLAPDEETHIYVQVGSQPGKTVCIYIKNAILADMPQHGDGGGLKTKTIAGFAGEVNYPELDNSAGGTNSQIDSLLKIGFL